MTRKFWLTALLLLVAGCASAFAFAPYEYVALLWIGCGILYFFIHDLSPLKAAAYAFIFTWGQFLIGVSWFWHSLTENGLNKLPSAAAIVTFCAAVALYPAVSIAIYRLCRPTRMLNALTFSAFWTLSEWLRSTLFTGFSWLDIGYANAGVTWLDPLAPFIGVYGLTFLTVFSSALCATAVWLVSQRHYKNAIISATIAFCWFPIGWFASHYSFTQPFKAPIPVTLIQGNLTMLEKWGPESLKKSQYLYFELTKKSKGRLIIWPETGIPRYLDNVEPEFIDMLLTYLHANKQTMITGVSMRERTIFGETYRAFNSLALFGEGGMQYYHKRHLVPFGEYIPHSFRWLVDAFIPMSDFTSGRELPFNPLTFKAQGIEIAPTICYEDAFGEEIIENAKPAHILINVSNLAWFGKHMALEQHFQISKMRALEMQRPLLSSTNTGVTGAIDEYGRVIDRLPNNTLGILELLIQGRTGETFYMKYGNIPVLNFCFMIVFLAFLTRKR